MCSLFLIIISYSLLPSFLPSFKPFFLPPFLPSFLQLSSFLPLFIPSFLPSFLPLFIPLFIPSFLPSFLSSFLSSFLPSSLPSFLPSSLYSLFPSFLPSSSAIRVLVHVVRGDSEDPVGDFIAINQELELFNPKLALKTQVTSQYHWLAVSDHTDWLYSIILTDCIRSNLPTLLAPIALTHFHQLSFLHFFPLFLSTICTQRQCSSINWRRSFRYFYFYFSSSISPPSFPLLLSLILLLTLHCTPLHSTAFTLLTEQVVVINKIDIPEVRDKLEELTKGIKKAAGHSRVLGISAATGER